MATLLGAAVWRARRASNLLFSQSFDLKAARRDPHEGRTVNRLARNLVFCAGAFVAISRDSRWLVTTLVGSSLPQQLE